MNFLKYYSSAFTTLAVVLCLFTPEDTYEFIGGLLFVPVAIFLWLIAINYNIIKKETKQNEQ